MPKNNFGYVANKEKIAAKIKLAKEFKEKQDKAKELHENSIKEMHENQRNSMFSKAASRKTLLREKMQEIKQSRLQFLKEFSANITYGALPIDSDIKEPLKDKIVETVFDYFENNANGSLFKSIATLTNPTANYNAAILGNATIDKTALALFDCKQELNSYSKMDAPPGRVTALDLINITNANDETAVNLKAVNEQLRDLEERAIDLVKDKVVTILKEEAEISEASRFLNENMQNDPATEIKYKHLRHIANKNTIFKEVCKNVHTFNEGVNDGSGDEYMAEAILHITLQETLNTLYLEALSTQERINKLQKERTQFLAKKREVTTV